MTQQSELGIRLTANAVQALAEFERLQKEIRALGGSFEGTGRQIATAGQTVTRLGKQSNAAAADTANLAAQFNDIAVMIASGQNPLILAVQQGSQIAQVLGNTGAAGAVGMLTTAFGSLLSPVTLVTIGLTAGVAALGQWAISAFSAEDAASDAENATAEFSKSLQAYRAYAAIAQQSTEELRKEFGVYAESVKAQAREMLRVTASNAIQSVAGVGSNLRGQLSATLSVLDEYNEAFEAYERSQGQDRNARDILFTRVQAATRALADFNRTTGISTSQVRQLDQLFADLAASSEGSLEDVQAALQATYDALIKMYQGREIPLEVGQAIEVLEGQLTTLKGSATDAAAATRRQLTDALQGAGRQAGTFADLMIDAAEKVGLLDDSSLVGITSGFDGLIGRAQQFLGLVNNIADGLDAGDFEQAYALAAGTPRGSETERLVRAATVAAERLGVSVKDLLTVMSFETGGTFRTDITNPTGHTGLIQFSPANQQRYRVNAQSSIEEQVAAAERYLREAGIQSGDGLLRIYAAILTGNPNNTRASDFSNGGTPGGAAVKVAEQMGGHITRAEGLLAAYAGTVAATTEEEAQLLEGRRANVRVAEAFIAGNAKAQEALRQVVAATDEAATEAKKLADAQRIVQENIDRGNITAEEGAAIMAQFAESLRADDAREAARKVERLRNELLRLQGSLDPATAASLEFASAQKIVAEAVAAGLLSAAEGQATLAGLTAQQIADSPAGRAAIEAAEDTAERVKAIWTGLSDGIVDWMVDGFKGGFDTIKDLFADTLKQLLAMALRNRIMIPIQMGASGGPLPATGPGSGIMGSIGRAFGAFGSGFGSVFSGFASGGFGGAFGAIKTALGGITSGLGGFATALGAIAAPLAIVGGIFAAFRKKTELLDSGLRVTIKGMDALVRTFSKVKTSRFFGLVSNTSTKTRAASPEIANPIQDAYTALRESAVDMGKVLGASALRLENFSYKFSVSLKGMTDEQKARAIEAEMGKLSDAMALRLVPTIKQFAKLGEGAADTLKRLSSSLLATNAAFKSLGFAVYASSVEGAAAAAKFVDVFGSIDAMAQATGFYFENFYSQAEQLADAQRRLGEGIADLGLTAVPQTEAEFRALVDSLAAAGKMTEAGGLIKLAPIFQEIQEAADALADSLDRNDFASRFEFERAQGLARNAAARVPGSTVATSAQIAEAIAAMDDKQTQLGLKIEQSSFKTSRVLELWERIGMPQPRAA